MGASCCWDLGETGVATYGFITDCCCLGSKDFCSLSQVGEKLGAGDSAIFMLGYENRASVHVGAWASQIKGMFLGGHGLLPFNTEL